MTDAEAIQALERAHELTAQAMECAAKALALVVQAMKPRERCDECGGRGRVADVPEPWAPDRLCDACAGKGVLQ